MNHFKPVVHCAAGSLIEGYIAQDYHFLSGGLKRAIFSGPDSVQVLFYHKPGVEFELRVTKSNGSIFCKVSERTILGDVVDRCIYRTNEGKVDIKWLGSWKLFGNWRLHRALESLFEQAPSGALTA